MNKKRVIDLVKLRPILAELEKARTAVTRSEFEAFQSAAMRAILLMSAAKMTEDEPPLFQASRL